MATTTNAKATLHQRAIHELKEFAILAVYLYITLGAVVLMKTAVLHTEGIEFAPWGIAVVKAAVLAKFMLLGNAMKIGGRNTTRPLIWPTLHKAFAFLVLLIIMTIIEEAVVGLFHHRSIASSLSELEQYAERVQSARADLRDADPARGLRSTPPKRGCQPGGRRTTAPVPRVRPGLERSPGPYR